MVQRMVLVGEARELGDRGAVAAHAEDQVADDQVTTFGELAVHETRRRMRRILLEVLNLLESEMP